MPYRNAAHAFIGELEEIQQHGRPVTVRGAGTRELLARTVMIQRPCERFITIPGRRNDVFATIAETMWVLAGREDVGFLSRYLKRAGDYSDDGQLLAEQGLTTRPTAKWAEKPISRTQLANVLRDPYYAGIIR